MNQKEITDLTESLDVKRGVRVRLRRALKEIRGAHLENLPTLDPVFGIWYLVFGIVYSSTYDRSSSFRKNELLSINSERTKNR